jgi:hypothetical protein
MSVGRSSAARCLGPEPGGRPRLRLGGREGSWGEDAGWGGSDSTGSCVGVVPAFGSTARAECSMGGELHDEEYGRGRANDELGL